MCSNLAESFAKRVYPKHFAAKLTDAMGENYETQVWLQVALNEKYISEEVYQEYQAASEEVGRLLTFMHQNPHKFT
ncbi:four helix bundle protein [Lewinella antarctica]|uniref:Four helix bundle protein n=1 Tax=Neolewinella antarctica TaxID=442734 RepID=A0ABX0XET7_9BACT|nr:four helix bundle protein [Neolewinella antarctica]